MILDLHEKGLLDGVDPVLRLRLIQATLAASLNIIAVTQHYLALHQIRGHFNQLSIN